MPLGGPAAPCTGKSGWLGSVAPCRSENCRSGGLTLFHGSAGTAPRVLRSVGMASNVSLFPPSSKGQGAACMRARAEVFERNIYSAAPHAAQRRRHARGACKGQVQKSRAGNRRSAPPARLRTPRSRRLAPPAHRTGQGRPRKVRSRACFDCSRAPKLDCHHPRAGQPSGRGTRSPP